MNMLVDACTKAVVGLSAFIEAISCLEAELKATQDLVKTLEARLEAFEDQPSVDENIETLIEDKIDSFLNMRLDDEIESRLSGREVDVNISGTITL
jgi:hypothetical protein